MTLPLDRPRYEVLPLDGIVDEVRAHVPESVTITVTASPAKGLEPTLAVAEGLARHGYRAVPHLSARLLRDGRQLDDAVARLKDAGVGDIFVIAGDAPRPAGDFASAAELLSALAEPFSEVGISGYPESHPLISDDDTIAAMFAKEPMATYIVSQICFDPAVIATWVRRVRARGTTLPIWIGVPGAVANRDLVKVSLRIGLGQSARFLRAHRGWVRRLARPRRYTPTTLLRRLAPLIADPAAGIGGIHVFTFNELQRTEHWRRQLTGREQ